MAAANPVNCIHRRKNGYCVIDFNGVDEEWAGTVNYKKATTSCTWHKKRVCKRVWWWNRCKWHNYKVCKKTECTIFGGGWNKASVMVSALNGMAQALAYTDGEVMEQATPATTSKVETTELEEPLGDVTADSTDEVTHAGEVNEYEREVMHEGEPTADATEEQNN